jgi:hypothetical protein
MTRNPQSKVVRRTGDYSKAGLAMADSNVIERLLDMMIF